MRSSIGKEFLRNTRYSAMGPTALTEGLPQPPLHLEFDPDSPLIELPEPPDVEVRPVTVKDAIALRRSVRRFSETPMSLAELSFLLWSTQGVKKAAAGATFRTVPSAGARHSFETYLLVNRVEGLEPGLYRYIAVEHRLLPVTRERGVHDAVTNACLGQECVEGCAVSFIWTAVAYRMTWRYGVRGYRYLFLDAGHVCQNLYLAVETVDCGACAVGAFDDEALDRALGIDGEDQFAIYAAAVGKRK